MRRLITLLAATSMYVSVGQTNIIPNGDFEYTPNNGSSCLMISENATNPPSIFDAAVYNWKTAIHNNGASSSNEVGKIYFVDESLCNTNLNNGSQGCGSFPTVSNSGANGDKYAIIKANYIKCTSLQVKIQHGAIGVALENGATFGNGTTYIIRYKIVPMRSTNQDNSSGGDFCSYDNNEALHCHMRFFLSENGPANWNDNSSDQMEMLSANFQTMITTYSSSNLTPCEWQQEERTFTPDRGDYTTLVIYAERGAAAIDEVEVFERCESYKYVQNKIYLGSIYQPLSVDGNNMSEKAGINVYAGNNVDATRASGNVETYIGSNVIYTASNAVALKAGFSSYYGSNFKAVIAACPNTLNRTAHPENTNVNPDPNYIPAPPLKRNQELAAEEKQQEIDFKIASTTFPNPVQNVLSYTATKIEANSKFTILTMLGQVVGTKIITEDKEQVDFDISGMAKGVYFLNHYSASGQLLSVHKMVKE